MNLQQLEYIVALDKFKSFSKAADACYITQATLSTMVKKLEDELGLVLFDRKTNPIITTECGQEIIAEAQKVLLHSNRLKLMSSEIKNKIEGVLNLGIIPTIAGNLLHRILPTVMSKYPDLRLNIQELTTGTIIERLKTGLLDAGIVSTPLRHFEIEEEILYYEKLMVYGRGLSSNIKYLTPGDFADEKIWLLEQGNCLTDQIVNICSLNTKPMSASLNFRPNSFDSLLNMVDSLHGLTLIPELYYADLPHERRANVRDFSAPYPVREVSMIFYRPYAKLKLIQALSAEIKTLISPLLHTHQLKSSEMRIANM